MIRYRIVCAFAGQEELEHNHLLFCNFAVHFAHKSFDAKLNTSKAVILVSPYDLCPVSESVCKELLFPLGRLHHTIHLLQCRAGAGLSKTLVPTSQLVPTTIFAVSDQIFHIILCEPKAHDL